MKVFMNKKAIDQVMTPFPHSIGPEQTLKTAKDLMTKQDIRHLPVRDGGRIVGILSDRDIDFALRVDNKEPQRLLVRDAATSDVFSVLPTTLLKEVVQRMASDKIGCALVEDKGKLVGIFTAVDACRVLSEVL
jgi:acetoin utilization protein AcuB